MIEQIKRDMTQRIRNAGNVQRMGGREGDCQYDIGETRARFDGMTRVDDASTFIAMCVDAFILFLSLRDIDVKSYCINVNEGKCDDAQRVPMRVHVTLIDAWG